MLKNQQLVSVQIPQIFYFYFLTLSTVDSNFSDGEQCSHWLGRMFRNSAPVLFPWSFSQILFPLKFKKSYEHSGRQLAVLGVLRTDWCHCIFFYTCSTSRGRLLLLWGVHRTSRHVTFFLFFVFRSRPRAVRADHG